MAVQNAATLSAVKADLDACPHHPPCPGCPRFAEHGIAPAARRALDELAALHGLPAVAVIAGDRSGFRTRARLAIRGRVGSPKVGLFEIDSHRVVHIPNCKVHHPLINRVASVVRRVLAETKMTSYSERVHLGWARYLQVVVERASQTAQVVLVANGAEVESAAQCLNLIRERLGKDLHSLWLNVNCSSGNTILGKDFHHWCGPPSVLERFGGANVHYPPGAFGQSNLDIAERIIDHVRLRIPQGARAAEFYAGVGAIGLSILPRLGHITMNEVSPESLKGLELGLAELDALDRSKVSVVAGEAGAVAAHAAEAQVVIADPPRKGLDAALTEHLRVQPPERFIYVSCGLDSLCRDAALLTAGGELRLTELTVFDLLPYTEHVESVACFERSTSRICDVRNP
jgi:23S rRNA (uracil1939-C5)-methyltransferase